MTQEAESPRVQRVLETALYVDDVARALRFYAGLIGLDPLTVSDDFAALDAGGGTVLLLFERGSAAQGTSVRPDGWIPPHDGSGPAHVALAIGGGDELERWISRLRGAGVPVEGRVTWPRGGRSIYVRDPDGHSVELATPGIWPVH